jgi:peptidoglycan/LPS O-acetylase OafA/YrhL
MKNKFVALDGIRGLAALFVLTRHTTGFWGFLPVHSHIAVDIFFLLSGFVIAHSYESRLALGTLSTRDFIVTRVVRLYPMYLLATIVAIALMLGTLTGLESGYLIVFNGVTALLMIPQFNLHDAAMFPLLGVTWSLFFELIVNLLYVLTRPALTSKVLVIVIAACAIVIAAVAYRRGGLDYGRLGTPVEMIAGLSRATFGILLGVLLYRQRERVWKALPQRFGPYGATAMLCCVLALPSVGRLDTAIELFAVFALFPLLVMAAARTEPKVGVRFMTVLGIASYPLYLLHPLFAEVFILWMPAAVRAYAPISGIALMLFMVALSLALERFIDLPTRKALSLWFLRTRTPKPAALPAAV